MTGVTGAWVAVTRLLMILIFLQSVFAGLLLSGEGWGRTAHRLTAYGLVAGVLLAGVIATVTLRRVPAGPRLATLLIALGLALAAQMAVGIMSANGERLLWLHVPLGVALVGFAAETVSATRQLDRSPSASEGSGAA
jgi:multisubunit Na+/H+ antiporter MnhF subunit